MTLSLRPQTIYTHKRKRTVTIGLCAQHEAGDSHGLSSLILTENWGLTQVPDLI